MTQPLVYIIILNWNGYKDTKECIYSIQKITYKNYKIIIVDNGSSDQSVKILKKLFPGIYIFKNKHNLGYAEGNNLGIKYSIKHGAEYCLILNNDTIVEENFLTEIVKVAVKDRRIAIVSPIIYYSDKPNMIWYTGMKINYKRLHPFEDKSHNKIIQNFRRASVSYDCVTGCCMLLRKNAILNGGLLDSKYFLYVEDLDLCLRYKKIGYKIVVASNAKIWHKVSQSSGGETSLVHDYYNSRNFLLYAKKNLSNFEKIFFYFYFIIRYLLLIAKRSKEAYYMNIVIITLGIMHGIRGKTGKYNIY